MTTGWRGDVRSVVWYWPHPHRSTDEVAERLVAGGIEVTVECLGTVRGEHIDRPESAYAVVADLPEAGTPVTRGPRRSRRRGRSWLGPVVVDG